MGTYELGLSPRICKDGKAIFGKGGITLLKGVQQTGSLRQAATQMAMSYKKAIRILKRAEEGLGTPLLARTIGGKGGGGSNLTPFAEKFLSDFQKVEEEIDRYGNTLFEKMMQENLSLID